jgi:hypothetical protein
MLARRKSSWARPCRQRRRKPPPGARPQAAKSRSDRSRRVSLKKAAGIPGPFFCGRRKDPKKRRRPLDSGRRSVTSGVMASKVISFGSEQKEPDFRNARPGGPKTTVSATGTSARPPFLAPLPTLEDCAARAMRPEAEEDSPDTILPGHRLKTLRRPARSDAVKARRNPGKTERYRTVEHRDGDTR